MLVGCGPNKPLAPDAFLPLRMAALALQAAAEGAHQQPAGGARGAGALPHGGPGRGI